MQDKAPRPKAPNIGADVEKLAEDAADQMRNAGIADLTRNYAGVRGRMDGKQFRGRWIAKGTTDFEGIIAGDPPIFVRVEIKATTHPTLPMSAAFGGRQHEVDALDRTIAWGARAYLLVVFKGDSSKWYLFPWEILRDVQQVGDRGHCRATWRVRTVRPDARYEAPTLFLEREANRTTEKRVDPDCDAPHDCDESRMGRQ